MEFFEMQFLAGKVKLHKSLSLIQTYEGVTIVPTVDKQVEIDRLRAILEEVSTIVGEDCDCNSHGPCVACTIKPGLIGPLDMDLTNEPFGI